ncbi:MAG: type II 3-dehydroquinate dehydratase [Kiloniellales bacterium]
MAQAPNVLILNGPNLNLLGRREPEIYGSVTLAEIEASCLRRGAELGLTVECRQSNSEGQLVDWIQEAMDARDGVIFNPGAYSHTSIALLDAVQAVHLPVFEVHLSNIHKRESFRAQSFVSKVADGVIAGFGADGYLMALEAMARRLIEEEEV